MNTEARSAVLNTIRIFGLLLSIGLLGAGSAGAQPKSLPTPVPSQAAPAIEGNHVNVIVVQGIVNTGTGRFIARAIEQSEKGGAALLAVVLNTPGGLLTSTREIVQKINQSHVPVLVFVHPGGGSATSAGTIVTMSAHVAAMAPGTNIGAAHPVGGQGEDIKGDMKDKAENDTVAFIRAQALLRKRNADWAEQAIRKSVAVTAEEAAEKNVVDFVAQNPEAAILKSDGRVVDLGGERRSVKVAGLPIKEIAMTPAEKFLTFLGDPNISYLLMALGGLGIYAELSSPGLILPGVLGAIALILAFISFATLPVNYGGVALLVLAMVLFVAEAFVTSYGILTIGGVVSLLLGALFLMDASTGDLKLSLSLVIPTAVAIGLISAFIGWSMLKLRRTPYQGLTNFGGFTGVVESLAADGKSGKCHIRGETWDFRLDPKTVEHEGRPLHIGDHLAVVRQEGFVLLMKHASSND